MFNKTAIIALLSFVLLSTVVSAQEEQLSFIPIDSIQITPTAIKAYDVNNDGIDDLLIGTNGAFSVYDGATRQLIWQDTEHLYYVTAIEVGDIEGDGLPDYFIGHYSDSLNNYTYYLTVYYGTDLTQPINWPGPLTTEIHDLHFLNQLGIPYLNIVNVHTLRINLNSWSYTCFNPKCTYLTDQYYYSITTHYDSHDFLENRILHIYSNDFVELTHANLINCSYGVVSLWHSIGAFTTETETCFCFYRACFYIDEPDHDRSLYLGYFDASIRFIEGVYQYPEIISARNFWAANIYGDGKDELFLTANNNDTQDAISFILNGLDDNYIQSVSNDTLITWDIGNFDDDEYDEIISTRNGYLIINDPIIHTVGIDDRTDLPRSFKYICYPNPFNNNVIIKLTNSRNDYIKIAVYNLLGQLVDVLFDDIIAEGNYSISWQPDLNDNPSGIYFVKVSSSSNYISRRITYIK